MDFCEDITDFKYSEEVMGGRAARVARRARRGPIRDVNLMSIFTYINQTR